MSAFEQTSGRVLGQRCLYYRRFCRRLFRCKALTGLPFDLLLRPWNNRLLACSWPLRLGLFGLKFRFYSTLDVHFDVLFPDGSDFRRALGIAGSVESSKFTDFDLVDVLLQILRAVY